MYSENRPGCLACHGQSLSWLSSLSATRTGFVASLVLEEVAGAVNGIKGSIALATAGAVAIIKAAMVFFIIKDRPVSLLLVCSQNAIFSFAASEML